ncbi:MAG: aconitate hydratase AcnA [Gallionella sp.]|nr:aconitate hydratase AcnA [Gallionella sp.]
MSHNLFNTRTPFNLACGKKGTLYSLEALEAAGLGKISRLPVSIRIVLEAVLRNYDDKKITESHVRELAGWQPNAARTEEIPFVVARIVLQDFTGVPLLADLAAMRNAAAEQGCDPKIIEPLVPVNLVVDHSVQIDSYNNPDALRINMELEFERNTERYRFMKWGMQAFDTFGVVPPGIGIVHQVNLEYLARGVQHKDCPEGRVYYPDTLVGTDSHTTMINGIGVVGWGVGGIEAEAGMLGQPVYFLTPDVVGVNLTGALREGVTATDVVLTVTELLRRHKVVGKFVEFFGEGTRALSLPDRATIANMAPEYGATMGFFPVDDVTVSFMRNTGRTEEELDAFESYFKAQGLYGIPEAGQIDYSNVVELDLSSIVPSLAGPKRPQDRIALSRMRESFDELFSKPVADNGFNQPAEKLMQRYATGNEGVEIGNGDVLIAAITSCTNTSNPSVMLAAGLLAKKAVARGLSVKPHIKTTLAPGSRVVTEYLTNAGLLAPLAQLGFSVAAYGCTTCIGNSGPLDAHIEETIVKNNLIAAAVLSGNRNFEARIHANIKANFLASPPLVIAYAIAGRMNINLDTEALGVDSEGTPVFLRDIWPSGEEIRSVSHFAADPAIYRSLYADLTRDLPLWNAITAPAGELYQWDDSTYIARPPFFDAPAPLAADISGARALAIFGDSVTTDHISPAGSFRSSTPAGKYLLEKGVAVKDFNSYGSRRGNHEVMMRGTFANVRIKNLMLPANDDGSRTEGGYTLYKGEQTAIYDAAMSHIADGTPTVIFAGEEYGTGSSRDWAAKGTQLLGVKAVIAKSYERIHRSNLVGMGVLPLQFKGDTSAASLELTGDESFAITGIQGDLKPQQDVLLTVTRSDGSTQQVPLLLRIDTPIEVDYYRAGGILPYVLKELVARS